jgi:hypothetical protein
VSRSICSEVFCWPSGKGYFAVRPTFGSRQSTWLTAPMRFPVV